MSALTDILTEVRQRVGLSRGELAARLDVSPSTITVRELGRVQVPSGGLEELARVTGATLAVGPSGWFVVDPEDPLQPKPDREDGAHSGERSGEGLPVVAGAGAGPAIIADGVETEWVDIARRWYRRVDHLIRIEGDSMYPMFYPGDTVGVVICTEKHLRSGDIVVCRYPYDGSIIVKVYRGRIQDLVCLQSLNPVHDVWVENPMDIEVKGRVVGLFRSNGVRFED